MCGILTALTMKVARFWAVVQCSSADKYQRNTRTLIQ